MAWRKRPPADWNAAINAPITKQGAQQLAAGNRVQLADGAAQLPPVRRGE